MEQFQKWVEFESGRIQLRSKKIFHFSVNKEIKDEVCDVGNKPEVSGPQNK
jgi:hypothetical protein